MHQFADAEAKRLEENSIENEACAFMVGIEVKSTYVDKRCARCVEFVTKIDKYALHNTHLIADLEKNPENSLLFCLIRIKNTELEKNPENSFFGYVFTLLLI
ncbi:hypothetical protein Hanom_Chr00s001186g01675311 [Helianthus anomalus]